MGTHATGDGVLWGVAQGCDCRSILDAIALLIEAQRPDLAMHLIEQELNSPIVTECRNND